MRRGKQIAQGAHASMKIFFDRIFTTENRTDIEPGDPFPDHRHYMDLFLTDAMEAWATGTSFTKICAGVSSEEELVEIYEKALAAGIPAALIEDQVKICVTLRSMERKGPIKWYVSAKTASDGSLLDSSEGGPSPGLGRHGSVAILWSKLDLETLSR